MNEETVVYADLKKPYSKKQKGKTHPAQKRRDTNGKKMLPTEYAVIFPNSQRHNRLELPKEEVVSMHKLGLGRFFCEPSGKKRMKRPPRNAGFYCLSRPQTQESQQMQRTPEHTRNKEFRPVLSGCVAAVILGLTCFILLGISAFFTTKYFQASYKYENNDIQNSSIHTENKCLSKDQLNSEKYREAYKNKWSCCGEKCYYFSHEDKNFTESRKFCVNLGSHLVKIEDKDEQAFIQSLMSYFYWIGLSRKGIVSPWMWEDGSLMHYNLTLQGSHINGNCVYATASKVATTVCTNQFFFICEKKSPNSGLKSGEDK